MQSNHAGKSPFRCEVCQMTFNCRSSLVKHGLLQDHIRPKKCTVCSRIYSSHPAKQAHFRKYHLGGKYNCQLCDGAFTERDYLWKHLNFEHKESKNLKLEREKSAL